MTSVFLKSWLHARLRAVCRFSLFLFSRISLLLSSWWHIFIHTHFLHVFIFQNVNIHFYFMDIFYSCCSTFTNNKENCPCSRMRDMKTTSARHPQWCNDIRLLAVVSLHLHGDRDDRSPAAEDCLWKVIRVNTDLVRGSEGRPLCTTDRIFQPVGNSARLFVATVPSH